MHSVRIACPRWEEDGPWPSNFERPCSHLRMEIGLPLNVEVLIGIVGVISECSCGENLVILTTAPESRHDED